MPFTHITTLEYDMVTTTFGLWQQKEFLDIYFLFTADAFCQPVNERAACCFAARWEDEIGLISLCSKICAYIRERREPLRSAWGKNTEQRCVEGI